MEDFLRVSMAVLESALVGLIIGKSLGWAAKALRGLCEKLLMVAIDIFVR